MHEDVSFFSDGIRLAARVFQPADRQDGERRPAIVVCQGFGGTMEYNVGAIAERLAGQGYVALTFDYRGFGASEGPRWRLIPDEQARDARHALTYLRAPPRPDRRIRGRGPRRDPHPRPGGARLEPGDPAPVPVTALPSAPRDRGGGDRLAPGPGGGPPRAPRAAGHPRQRRSASATGAS